MGPGSWSIVWVSVEHANVSKDPCLNNLAGCSLRLHLRCHNFGGLVAARFLLVFAEAAYVVSCPGLKSHHKILT